VPRWQPHNVDGNPVDPVPFIISVLTAFLVTHAWGPIYLDALGISLVPALVLLTALWLVIAALAYRQLVWYNRPERRKEVPMEVRVRKFVYAFILGCLLLISLALPLRL